MSQRSDVRQQPALADVLAEHGRPVTEEAMENAYQSFTAALGRIDPVRRQQWRARLRRQTA